MQFTFTLINEAGAREVRTWRYAEPYAIYSLGSDPEEEGLAEL